MTARPVGRSMNFTNQPVGLRCCMLLVTLVILVAWFFQSCSHNHNFYETVLVLLASDRRHKISSFGNVIWLTLPWSKREQLQYIEGNKNAMDVCIYHCLHRYMFMSQLIHNSIAPLNLHVKHNYNSQFAWAGVLRNGKYLPEGLPLSFIIKIC